MVEKLCVTFLLCDPDWFIHKSDVQNKWNGNTLYNTHTHKRKSVAANPDNLESNKEAEGSTRYSGLK